MTERPSFTPSVEGVRDVLHRARARKRKKMLAAGSGLAAAATIVTIVVAGPGVGEGADRLTVIPASPGPSVTAPAPGSTPSAPQPAVTPAAGPSTPGSHVTAEAPSAGSSAAGTPLPSGTAVRRPASDSIGARRSAAAPITRTTVGFNSACQPANDVAGWCTLYTGPTTARRKHTVVLSMELCRPAVDGDGTISFTSGREITLTVDGSNGSAWQAGQGVRYPAKGSTTVVRAGTCLRWSAAWDTIAPNGFYAPPGSYSITAQVDTTATTGLDAGNAPTLTLTD